MTGRKLQIVAGTVLALSCLIVGSIDLTGAELAGTAEQRLLKDIRFLASDEMEGRGVGTEGLHKAAEFVRSEFKAAGLKVDAVDGDAFQKFSMITGVKLGESNSLTFVGPDDQKIELKIGEDCNVCSFGGSAKLDHEVVFGGYGINAKGIPYMDFDGVDVKGKVVIVMRRTPQQGNKKSPFATGHGISRHAELRTKVSVCSTAGAAAILFVNDPHSVQNELEKMIDQATNRVVKATRALSGLEPDDEGREDAKKKLDNEIRRLDKAIGDAHSPNAGDNLMKFGYAGNGRDGAIPALHISVSKCNELLNAALKTSLDNLEGEIDASLKPASAFLKGWKVVGQTDVTRVRTEVKNVLAVLEGEGPLADETIVVGAHYDHVGRGGAGSHSPGSTEIHNGADDNASGTVALIELARRLASREKPLPRRVVFIAFTAEELGLIGSEKYVSQPVFPLEKTIAMYNMDMVGRLREKLTVFGIGTSPLFKDEVTEFAKAHEVALTLKPDGFGPSDHSSFYAKKIPVLHFFTGTHSDYHRPGDDWDKINLGGMQKVVGLLEDMVVKTAITEKRPAYLEVKSRAQITRSGSRPYFGSIPNFGSEDPGYAISDTAPGSPANKGGLKGGDHIIKFGKHTISDLNDFDLALRDFSAGDEVDVVVRRDGEEVKLKVTLAKPR
ncbi:MAG: M20/M25/M40 family metallo-hydrolase [Planctomycetes bacterium]|nr:M20/M25/M40 family metallo-hydrolase [Planctomycetota bacterium]